MHKVNILNLNLQHMASKLLVGFAAGVLAGILLAPDKGSETRQKIADAARDLKDKFNDFVDDLDSKADDLADEAENLATETKTGYK
jgi:gas vesicle protein